ncbi:MAG: glycosyltransferase family 2 protein [Abditibacteriales bacterium]|nr:glycosyltransferase family 2 protein [Abditibacteriales bacterium]MDW8365686.1 glycosyltransferase family 2 protein [Abditibacteriales bacterium]
MAEVVFWGSLLTIVYVYFGYPLLLALLAVFRQREIKKADITPSVTILISAYNEEGIIRQKLENMLALDYPKDKLEIIVGSDGSTDRTNEIVREFADNPLHLPLRKGESQRGSSPPSQGGEDNLLSSPPCQGGEGEGVVVVLDAAPERRGKCAVLYRCVPKARGEIIVFSDADAMYPPDALRKLVRGFADERVGCIEGVRWDTNEEGQVLESIYWKYENVLKRLASKNRCIVGATGAIFAIRKHLYFPLNEERGDDFELPIRIALRGYDTIYEPDAVVYHPWLPNHEEFRRITRIVSWMLPSALMLLKESLQRGKWLVTLQLLSHKLLRWFVPVFMMAMLVSNLLLVTGHFYRAALWMQGGFYGLALVGYLLAKARVKLRLPLLNIPYYFCLINLASLNGVMKLLLGKPVRVWRATGREAR